MSLPKPNPRTLAVVTGASSGIGEALARQLAELGYPLLLVARRADRLNKLAADLTAAHGIKVEVRPTDLADATGLADLCAELAGRRVDILCNNAGAVNWGAVHELDANSERTVVALNTVAVHDLTLAVLPGMVRRGMGAIEMTGSIAGVQPMPGCATYSATKAFVNTFCESLHEELKNTGVSCTLLAPGPVSTGITEASGISGVHGAGGGLVWMSAERVARDTLKAMGRGRRVLVPGLFAKLNALSGRHTPHALLLPVLREVNQRVLELGRRQKA